MVAYSRCGRTIALKRFKNISLSINVNILNISPRFLFSIEILLPICSQNDNELSMMTPRYFSDSTFFNLISSSCDRIV